MNLRTWKKKIRRVVKRLGDLRTFKGWKISFKPIIRPKKDKRYFHRKPNFTKK